ncbi:MAG TPA: hypothetical protein VGK61_08935 [Planctomycetota bacterium]|jgi:hypothetical protein
MRTIFACSFVVLLCAACGKSDDSSSSSSDEGGSKSTTSKSAAGDKPWDDLSKPYLSDKKMGDFIESLKDADGPFDAVSKGKVTAFNAEGRMAEFEASAKKHGFASGEEYMGAWTRIGAAMMQVQMDASNQSMIQMQEESIKAAQEAMKKPDVTPDMKQVYEDQIKGATETLKVLKKPREEGVNAKDIETFKKHQAAFDEAMKKWSK